MTDFWLGYFLVVFLMYPIWIMSDIIDWFRGKNNKEDDE